jgi:V/A-type H+-transporting ATPase subunit E
MSSDASQDLQAEGFKKLVDAVLEEARVKSASIMNEATERAAVILEESQKFSLKHCEEILASYREMAEIESRKEISTSEIEARMQLLKLKESYVERVFEEAKKRLQAFVETPEYRHLMLDGLHALSKSITAGELIMNDGDIKKLGEAAIRKAAGVDVEINRHQVGIGGFIIISKDKKMSVDRTIDSMLNQEKQILRGKIADLLFG